MPRASLLHLLSVPASLCHPDTILSLFSLSCCFYFSIFLNVLIFIFRNVSSYETTLHQYFYLRNLYFLSPGSLPFSAMLISTCLPILCLYLSSVTISLACLLFLSLSCLHLMRFLTRVFRYVSSNFQFIKINPEY